MKITLPKQIISNPITKQIILDVYNKIKVDTIIPTDSYASIVLTSFIKYVIHDAKNMLINYGDGSGTIFKEQLARWRVGNVEISAYEMPVKI